MNDIKIQEIKSLKKETDKNLFERYTNQDLVNRVEASMEDLKAGKTIKLTDLKLRLKVGNSREIRSRDNLDSFVHRPDWSPDWSGPRRQVTQSKMTRTVYLTKQD